MSRTGVRILLIRNLSQRRTDYSWTKANVRLICPFNVQWMLDRGFIMHLLGCLPHGWYWWFSVTNDTTHLYYYEMGKLVLRIHYSSYIEVIFDEINFQFGPYLYFSIVKRPWVVSHEVGPYVAYDRGLTSDMEIGDIVFKYNGLPVHKNLGVKLCVGDDFPTIIQKVMVGVNRVMEL